MTATPHIETGSGRPVVCSHGMLMDRTMYAPQLEALGDRFRVVAYDSRARTENWRGPYSLYELAEDCVELLDRLAIRRCVLVGMSMGGFMAIRMALKHPDRISALVLIGASADPYSDQDQDVWRERYEPLREQKTMSRDAAEAEAEFCFAPSWRQREPQEYEAWLRRWTAYRGEAVWWETLSWIEQDDVREQLGRISVPTMVIHGVDDTAVSLESAGETAARLGSRLVEIDDAGHTPNLERPGVVNEALGGFLSELGEWA